MSESTPDNNVAKFPEPPEFNRANDLQVISGVRCAHKKVSLSRQDRNLTCNACGAVLDLFDYLCAEVVKKDNFFRDSKLLERDLAKKRESIALLAEEERRVKARLATAKRALAKVQQPALLEEDMPAIKAANVVEFRQGGAT